MLENFLLERHRESQSSGPRGGEGVFEDSDGEDDEDADGEGVGGGWAPVEGVDDQVARGPAEFECVYDVVRFKPTRNTVLRLGV